MYANKNLLPHSLAYFSSSYVFSSMNHLFSGNFYDIAVAYTPTVGKRLMQDLRNEHNLLMIQTFPEQGIIMLVLSEFLLKLIKFYFHVKPLKICSYP